MLRFIFCILFFNMEVMGKKKHNYKIDNKKNYAPNYVCNYETYRVSFLHFKLYTCVLDSKCKTVGEHIRSQRKPQLNFDNCHYTFHPPANGGSYVCCHPDDNEDTQNNQTAIFKRLGLRYMSGFRSGFKCNDYKNLVCLSKKFCPGSSRRELKGGTETEIGKYPHLAAVGFYNQETNRQNWFCLGSIITEKYLLSAATCQEDKDGNRPSVVRLGETELCKLGGEDCKPSKYAQQITVNKQIHHPKNLLGYYYHDIMILKLDRSIEFNSHVRPACLFCDMGTLQSGGMFAMYEERTKNGKTENTTHEMEIKIFNKLSCSRWYSFDLRLVDPGIDPDIMFCAGLPQANKVPCKDDFGGPLQIQPDPPVISLSAGTTPEVPYCMWQIYGVMAWSQSFFCRGDKPPIFTRVPYYLDWIEKEVWDHFDMPTEYNTFSEKCAEANILPNPPEALSMASEGRCQA